MKKKYWIDVIVLMSILFFCIFIFNQIQNTLIYQWRWEDSVGLFFRLEQRRTNLVF